MYLIKIPSHDKLYRYEKGVTPLVLRLFYYIMHELVLRIFSDMNVVFQW